MLKESVMLIFLMFLFLIPSSFATAPNITDVHADPIIVDLNHETYLRANVTDVDNDLDKVLVNITSPTNESERHEMIFSNGLYEYEYKPSEHGIYSFYVWANDSVGNFSKSNVSYFLVPVVTLTKNITIRVGIAPSCYGRIAYFPPFDTTDGSPAKILQNQTVVFLIVFENAGNVKLTSRNFSMTITNKTVHTIASYSGSGYVSGDLDLWETDFYWNTWKAEVPVGNYTAAAYVDYRSSFESGNESYDDFSEVEGEADYCDPINQTTNTTTCYYARNSSCRYIPYGDPINVNTTQASDLTVSDMYSGTSGYEGTFTYENQSYYAINYRKSTCNEYCYSCVTPDRNINESEECNYEESTIPSTQFYVYSISSDGLAVTYQKAKFFCNYLEKIWDCKIYPDNSANCNVTYNCYGKAERIRPFEVVNVTAPITTTVPVPTPTPTPTPSPTPTPIPTPTPTPKAAIEIEPVNDTVKGNQETWIPNIINVTNIGDLNLTNITLIPIVPTGWKFKTALIDSLLVGQTLNRTVFVKPPFDALGSYVIPIKAVKDNVTLDLDYYWVLVLKAANKTVLQLLEVPRVVNMFTNTSITLPILVKNIGKLPLHNISARLENSENCLESFNFDTISELNVSEQKSMTLYLRSKKIPASCNSTLIVWSIDGAYAFADINIIVTPPVFALAMPKVPLLLIGLILLEFVLVRIKKSREARGEAGLINVPVYIVLFAIIGLFVYIFLWYIGYVEKII